MFQRSSRSSERSRPRIFRTFFVHFFDLFLHSFVPDRGVVGLEQFEQIRRDLEPPGGGASSDAGQLDVVGRQRSASVPHGDQEEHVGPNLLGREVQSVTDQIGSVELHKWTVSHDLHQQG